MYYPVNNFNNCSIFNKSLFQDLANHEVVLDNSFDLHVAYTGSTISDANKVTINTTPIIDLVSSTNQTINLWQPCMISSDTYTDYYHISRKTINNNPIFGISNILSFKPEFKNWTVIDNDSSNSAKMRCDWYINSIIGSQKPVYGLMFWYKYTINSMPFSELPINTKFMLGSSISAFNNTLTIDANTPLMKIDDATIKLLNKRQAIILSSTASDRRSIPVDFNTEKYVLSLSSINTGLSSSTNCNLYKENRFTKNNKTFDLYISNGDCFSYYYGMADELRNTTKSMPSRNYLSPALNKVYREVYHRLTLHKNKSFNPTMSVYSSRLFQKLCYYLSTGPLMDRTTIDILADKTIYDAVQAYIAGPYVDPGTEMSNLISILNTIYGKYKDLAGSDYDKTILSNHVSDYRDLFKCLTNKYGCSLWMSGNTTLKLKNKLKNGPHAIINTNYHNWRPKNTPASNPSYNNNSIQIGNISYKTNISTTESTIKVRADNWPANDNIEIPLADISITKKQPPSLYLGSGIYASETERNQNGEIEFDTNDLSNIFRDAYTDRNVSYFWEQVGGANCLRFDNYAKDQKGFKRYRTSSTDSPKIYVKQSGTYEVQCTRFNYGRIDSDVITLTTSSDLSLPDINQSALASGIDYPKIMTSNIKSIGFDKKGLVCILDSENYIDTNSYDDYDDIQETHGLLFYKDIKFDLNNKTPITIQNSNAELSLNFDMTNGNCCCSLFSLTVENVRDNNYQYSQCKSLYQEKIRRRRTRTNINIPNLGSSDFYRDFTFNSYTYIYHNIDGKIPDKSVELIGPGASTKYAPPILPYGGYGKEIVETIGISLPSHPSPASGFLPIPTGTIPNALPIIPDRNNVLSIDGNNPIACYLKEVSPTGNKHYVSFSKGHFHPISGWTTSLAGKSNVVLNKPELKKSYKFKGLGFSSIRSIPNNQNKPTIYQSKISFSENNFMNNEDVSDRYGFNNKNYDSKYNPNYMIDEYQDTWLDFGGDPCGSPSIGYGLDSVSANKTIKSIEVQISFLNHVNPKNLDIWLDISNASNTLSGTKNSSLSNIMDHKSASNSDIQNYMSNLKTANNNSSSLRIHLLSQEHISNYSNNFSVKFTDYASKYNTVTRADYGDAIPSLYVIKNNEQIQPSICAVSGYNDISINNNVSAIRTNLNYDFNNLFMKCSGLLLKDAIFTLNVANIEPIDTDNTVMDNLLNNNILNLQSSFDKTFFSTIRSDNICKWSVIVHTDDTRDSTDGDILGYIDYKNSINALCPKGYGLDGLSKNHKLPIDYIGSYTPTNPSGYDFMGNFVNKNFLIPLVNINAPYSYLANVSQCVYDDPDVPRSASSFPPSFPSLLSYALVGITAGIGIAGGLAGTMAGLSLASYALSQGGRNDPIINFYIDSRNYALSVVNNSQIYKPVYSNENFGYGDRAIVAVSTDGAIWYNIEVPIFKYSNTPVCHKNVYKYIKLTKNSPEVISRFNFKIINNITDLNLANVVGSVSENVMSRQGLSTINNITLQDNSIILLSNQNIESDNGYWLVSTGNWTKVPSTGSLYYMSYNNIGSSFVDSLGSNSSLKTNIMIDGVRAYNFFDIGETLELSQPSGATVTLVDKSIIATDAGQKTVFTISSGLSTAASIYKPDSAANVLYLYKDSSVSVNVDDTYLPFNLWSLESSDSYNIKASTPAFRISTIGEGGIGWGTDLIFTSPINRLSLSDNALLHKDDVFSNTSNDLYKLNQITVTQYDGSSQTITPSTTDTANNKIKASAYSYNSLGISYNNINKNYNSNSILNSMIKNIDMYTISDNKNKVLLDIKSDKFISLASSGYITFDGDSLFYKSVGFIDSDITLLKNRLSGLMSSDNNFDTSTVTDIYNVSGIKNLIKYYDSLPDDPIRCNQPQGMGPGDRPLVLTCQKMLTQKRIKELYKEKIDIDIALSNHNSTVSQPHISGIVTDHLPTGLIVNYIENNDLYWIHIDPNQKFLLNDEFTVKVFTTGYFYPVPIVETTVPTNVLTPGAGISNSFSRSNGSKINYEWKGSEQMYTIPESVVTAQKNAINQQFTSLSWTNDDVFVYGQSPTQEDFSNSKKIIMHDGQNKEYIIQLKEMYIRPSGLNRFGTISDVIDFANISNLKVKFRNLTRKLKSVDSENFDRYTYDYRGNLVRDLKSPSSVGQVANNFVCWHCFNTSGVYITGIPPFLIAANEMRYRAFFGSIDGIEHKNTFVSDSQEDWEWIPFEYYKTEELYFRGGGSSEFSTESMSIMVNEPTYDWEDIRNWFRDKDFTVQSLNLPEFNTDAIITTRINITKSVSVRSLVVSSEILNVSFGSTISVGTTAVFDGSSKLEAGSIVCDSAIFNGSSINEGHIFAYSGVIFNDTSINKGVIKGDVVFSNDSSNLGQIKESPTFNLFKDSSINKGEIIGNTIFDDDASNQKSIIGSSSPATLDESNRFYSVIFKGRSINYNDVGEMFKPSIFVKFMENARNLGVAIGSVIFSDNAINEERIKSDGAVIFTDNSINLGAGTIISDNRRSFDANGDFIFYQESIAFEKDSVNIGKIQSGDVRFDDRSINLGTIDDNLLFTGQSSCGLSDLNSPTLSKIMDEVAIRTLKDKVIDIYGDRVRFDQESSNRGLLTIESQTTVEFTDLSSNQGVIQVRQTPLAGPPIKFRNRSVNEGMIDKDANFYDSSINKGKVTGKISFE